MYCESYEVSVIEINMNMQNSKFSENVKDTLKRHIISDNLNKRKQQLETNIARIKNEQPPTSDVDVNSQHMLLANVFVDYLRSHNLNYTYSVFLKEASIASEDVVLREDLLELTRLHQSSKIDRLNFDRKQSVLEILYEVAA
jgi:hypothetical protein